MPLKSRTKSQVLWDGKKIPGITNSESISHRNLQSNLWDTALHRQSVTQAGLVLMRFVISAASLICWSEKQRTKKINKIPVYTQLWGKDGVAMTDKVVQARRRLKRREKYIWQHISSFNKNLCNSHVQQHCVLVYRLFQERAGRARQEVCCTPGRPDEVTLTFVSNREWGRFQIMHELKKSWLDGSEL